MVAPRRVNRIFCTIVRVAETDDREMNINELTAGRPSEMLPWADPTIAQLVSRLQTEVRRERSAVAVRNRVARYLPQLDLEPPSPIFENDADWWEDARWPSEGND